MVDEDTKYARLDDHDKISDVYRAVICECEAHFCTLPTVDHEGPRRDPQMAQMCLWHVRCIRARLLLLPSPAAEAGDKKRTRNGAHLSRKYSGRRTMWWSGPRARAKARLGPAEAADKLMRLLACMQESWWECRRLSPPAWQTWWLTKLVAHETLYVSVFNVLSCVAPFGQCHVGVNTPDNCESTWSV